MKIMRKMMVALSLMLVGCGSSPKVQSNTNLGPSNPNIVDASGNWVLTAMDSNNDFFVMSGVANQVGATVTFADIMGEAGPGDSSCAPLAVTFSNGNVGGSSGKTFTGTISSQGSGLGGSPVETTTLNFTSTLASDDMSITTGTYALVTPEMACFPAGANGTFSGYKIPSATGNWTGTIQPCSLTHEGFICDPTGTKSTMTATLTQDNSKGTVSGTYSVTNQTGITSGSVSPPGTLSGTIMSNTWIDANGSSYSLYGHLGSSPDFEGNLCDNSGNICFNLNMTH
jgi:hypothetical protein